MLPLIAGSIDGLLPYTHTIIPLHRPTDTGHVRRGAVLQPRPAHLPQHRGYVFASVRLAS